MLQSLLRYQEEIGDLDTFEKCLVHVNASSLDLHQTITLCWAHNMHDALLYIYR